MKKQFCKNHSQLLLILIKEMATRRLCKIDSIVLFIQKVLLLFIQKVLLIVYFTLFDTNYFLIIKSYKDTTIFEHGPNPIFFYPIWAQSDLLLLEARPDFTSLGSVLRDIDDFDSPCPKKNRSQTTVIWIGFVISPSSCN